jgi:hypothetical protein
MHPVQTLPLDNLDVTQFISKAKAAGEKLGWKIIQKKESEEFIVSFSTASNLNNFLGSRVELKYLNSKMAVVLVSSKNAMQVSDSGDGAL